jgi:hypothetical protein
MNAGSPSGINTVYFSRDDKTHIEIHVPTLIVCGGTLQNQTKIEHTDVGLRIGRHDTYHQGKIIVPDSEYHLC